MGCEKELGASLCSHATVILNPKERKIVYAKDTDTVMLRNVVRRSMTINIPAIRPMWVIVPGDDQNPDRIMTPAKAIKAGADRIVVGRPIVNAEKPYDAVMRTIEEIASVTS